MKKSFAKLARRSGSAVLAVATIVGMAAPATNLIAATTDNTVAAAKAQKVKSIKKSGSSYTVTVGKKQTLKATVTFSKKVNKAQAKKSVKVTSSASAKVKVASVAYKASAKKSKKWTVTATVKAVKAGSANITLKANKGAKAAKKGVNWKVTAKEAEEPTDDPTEETVAVSSVSLSTTTPKVGDTITAVTTPENATNVASYKWETSASTDEATASWAEITGETGSSLKVTAAMVEKFIRVTITDSEGETYTAVTTSPVANDATSDVSIIDVMGLQSDGTAVVGDRLRISYGATFGTPTAATWYKDGAVLTTASVGDGVANMINLDITPARGAGTYKATVVADGKTYTTNEIIVTNKEEQAVIKEFTIEDDYTDGSDIDYRTTDARAVVTVTLSKNYVGNIQLWKKSDSKYSAAIDNLVTDDTAVAAWVTSASQRNGAQADGSSILTSDQATNYTVENCRNGYGLGHINADGTVTYKFVANAGLTRGTEYVVTFDQSSITTDTPGTGTANVFATAVAAPYVIAPAKIAITKISNGNAPEITFQDAEGKTLQWLGKPARTAVAGTTLARGASNTLAATAFDTAAVYANTVKANDPTAATVTALSPGIGTGNTLVSGVWTGGAYAGSTAYWFAKVTAPAGIYGKDAITLTSEAVPVAQDAASQMNLVQDKDTATSAVVSFSNLRCDGTVYIIRGKAYGTNGATDYISTAENIYAGYNAVEGEMVSGSAQVSAGTASVTVPNAIGKYTGITGTGTEGSGDNYIALFVPADEANYGRIYTDNYSATAAGVTGFNENSKVIGTADGGQNDDSCGVQITQAPTSLKYDANGTDVISNDGADTLTITTSKIIAYDQFGDKVTTVGPVPATAATVTSTVATDKDIASAERAIGTYQVNVGSATTGATTINLQMAATGTNSGADDGDGYTLTVLGSTITIMNKSGAGLDKTDAAGWEIKFGSNTLTASSVDTAAAAGIATLNKTNIAANALDYNTTKTTDDAIADIKAGVLAKINAVSGLSTVTAGDLTFSAWTYDGATIATGDGAALGTAAKELTYTVTINFGGTTKTITGCSTTAKDND